MTAHAHESESQLPFERTHAHDSVEAHAHLGWENKYFSQGRDILDGDSLLAGSFELAWKHLAGEVWYGNSPEQRYDELQLTFGLTQSYGDFEFYIGYTHLRFPFDDSHDNEIGVGIVWSDLPFNIQLITDLYHSFNADGYFAEMSVSQEYSITNRLTLNFSSLLGINQGYIPDGHNGANHVTLNLGLEYAISNSISFTSDATYSWGLDRDNALAGDTQLTDLFHGSAGLQWSF